MLAWALEDIKAPCLGPGRPRTRPDAVIVDKAHSNGVNRRMLRGRGITAVIPLKSDEITARQRRGPAGGRPPSFDAETYKDRNVIERAFSLFKQWRALATRYDKLATVYRGGVVLAAILT
ncbi:transposase [Nesterenkonia alkaliphila]|uniref:Transposase n=1 Tax=Nesterenkonia alkaliphila TaxID=1463631 RepID=A0A7K1UL80_9MICC|nr:transposase [Nesterenkonia alkaliphila]GFZ97123.1 hypothetical protein GCM10011359_28150 [Nesterenkonia alkaliphila]